MEQTNQKEPLFLNLQFYLVVGTWIMAGAVIWSMFKTSNRMEEQTAELQKATELDWRPFLQIEHGDSIGVGFGFILSDAAVTDSSFADSIPSAVGRPLDSVPYRGDKFLAVKYMKYELKRNVLLKNTGATPMFVTHFLASSISQAEWEDTYGESVDSLVHDIVKWDAWRVTEVDNVIFAGDSVVAFEKGYGRRLPKAQLVQEIETGDSTLLFYPYTFIEYEDPYGHKYNSLFVQYWKIRFHVLNGVLLPEDSVQAGLERVRWDLDLPYD